MPGADFPLCGNFRAPFPAFPRRQSHCILGKTAEVAKFSLEKRRNAGIFSLEKRQTMLKRKIDERIRRHYATRGNALLVTGARQVGKTFSIREFGKNFRSFVEINFAENPDAAEALKTAKTSADILLRLSAMTSAPLRKGETLVFFDEVQLCPEIVTAIKFLVEDGSFRYILSGSLLGVELKGLRSEPVGYMDVMEMFPLDFEEFARSAGVSDKVWDSLRDAWTRRVPADAFVHGKMMDLFRLYLVVGGMPAAVSRYLETNNLREVAEIQAGILRLYRRDIAQYDGEDKLRIKEIFDLIPPELNAKNKRFILKRLNENAKFARSGNGFLWLKNAGIALPVYNVEEPKLPLLLARSRSLFKLFQNDVGLLACQYAEGIQLKIIGGNAEVNFGAVFENAVAQELAAHGFGLYYYNSKKRGELDFVVEHGGNVLPIEVKSGKNYETHRALANIMTCREYAIREALVLCNGNLRRDGKILYAPVYMVAFLEKKNDAPTFYKIDLSALR